MADSIQGKSIVAIAKDVAEGFFILNPLTLKKFEAPTYKALHQQLRKTQTDARAESFPSHDTSAIRNRNMKLQRLHTAMMILEHAAKEKRIPLA